ncbi:hypothetical protein TNCV_4531591 [Trichonephila clavipes]|nr:hypothetical protein TNCV_4531591 [Trichonephila clavipes]
MSNPVEEQHQDESLEIEDQRLVASASDSKPEGLGSIPDLTKYPPSTHGVRAHKSSGSESLVGGRSRAHECRGLENIPSPPVPCLNCGGGDRWCRHLS